MSYILDALKKSDQERQQGNPPSLYAVHNSIPPARYTSTFKLPLVFSLIIGVIFLGLACLGIFFFTHLQQTWVTDTTKATSTPLLSAEPQTPQATTLPVHSDLPVPKNELSTPRVVIKEKDHILRYIPVEDSIPEPTTVIETEASRNFPPLFKDLPRQLQAEIPKLKFAGHTFSEEPSQRMIIINGKILKEGDMIDPNTRLAEITWDGVAIDYKGTRFLEITN